MADRTAGVRASGYCFPVTAFPVLAHEHLSVFSVYFKHQFAALRTFVTGQIVMTESSVRILDLADK